MALAIQDYLRSGKTTDELTAEFGINVYRHPELPLAGFKYSSYQGNRAHPITREARGLVLDEKHDWNLVAKGFDRFFNAGEDRETFDAFDWSDFEVAEKLDGSLILVYFYDGQWLVNTSGSFGDGIVGHGKKSWRELFWETSGIDREDLDDWCTYVFELWTPFNKIVRAYEKSTATLLAMFGTSRAVTIELTSYACDIESKIIGVPRPERYSLKSIAAVCDFLAQKEKEDKTYEGVVLRDSKDRRIKAKTKTYLKLHHLLDNGNLFNPARLVPLILRGESEEVVAYLPEAKLHVERVRDELSTALCDLIKVWDESKAIESQKDFAQFILPRTAFSAILFQHRKIYGEQGTEAMLVDQWRRNGELISKRLYGD